MSTDSAKIASLSPHKLIRSYSQTPVWKYIIIAIGLHVIVVGVTSIGYLRAKITGVEPTVDATQPTVLPAPAPVAGAAPAPQAGTGQTTAPVTDTEAATLEQRKDTEMVKRITETASPDEIPALPSDLGISIKDTHVP